jgi:hypothetical protein
MARVGFLAPCEERPRSSVEPAQAGTSVKEIESWLDAALAR